MMRVSAAKSGPEGGGISTTVTDVSRGKHPTTDRKATATRRRTPCMTSRRGRSSHESTDGNLTSRGPSVTVHVSSTANLALHRMEPMKKNILVSVALVTVLASLACSSSTTTGPIQNACNITGTYKIHYTVSGDGGTCTAIPDQTLDLTPKDAGTASDAGTSSCNPTTD